MRRIIGLIGVSLAFSGAFLAVCAVFYYLFSDKIVVSQPDRYFSAFFAFSFFLMGVSVSYIRDFLIMLLTSLLFPFSLLSGGVLPVAILLIIFGWFIITLSGFYKNFDKLHFFQKSILFKINATARLFVLISGFSVSLLVYSNIFDNYSYENESPSTEFFQRNINSPPVYYDI